MNEIRGNILFRYVLITITFCLKLYDSIQECNFSPASVEYHPILLKGLCIFIQNSFKMLVGGMKTELGPF
jgi:hypothetical protein